MAKLKVRPTLVCTRADLPGLSANAEDAFWSKITSAAFRDVAAGTAPAQATDVRLAWDEEELRVLLHATDRHAWATITQRDGPLWEEEVVEVFLDPVGDAQSYFEIEVNPLGTVVDLVCQKIGAGMRRILRGIARGCGLRCEVGPAAGPLSWRSHSAR